MKRNSLSSALYLFVLLASFKAQAMPDKVEMIFLSPQKITQLLELIKKNQSEQLLGFIAQTDAELEKCIPMGEGCFHPQYGYLNKKTELVGKAAPVIAIPKDPEMELKTFNATETSLINCDKGNYFDIYCGKEKTRGKPSEIEVWFDISSSLRTVDYNKDPNLCNRRTFMTKVMNGCKDKVKVSVYNTSLKEVGDFSSVCMAYGSNDEAKILQWMKDSSAKRLLVITDIEEVSKAMRDFLDERGAHIIGDGVKPFNSSDLVDYANDFVKSCKK